jgi:CRISPR-associated protein (TIGR02584 family)
VTGLVQERYREALAAPDGKLDALCRALGRPSLWDRIDIRVLRYEGGNPIPDLRSDEDAAAFGDLVAEIVRQETLDDDAIVHLSLAGGRKTMSFHGGAAMNLFGQTQDELSHVLVHPAELESNDFWWPLEHDEWITGRDGKLYNAREGAAQVELALIPFVRVRGRLPRSLLQHSLRYGSYVAQVNAVLNGVTLELIVSTCTVKLPGLDIAFQLENAEFALYWLMAEWAKAQVPGAGPDGVGAGNTGWLTPEMFGSGQEPAAERAALPEATARFAELCGQADADSTAQSILDQGLDEAPEHYGDRNTSKRTRKGVYDAYIKHRLSRVRSKIQCEVMVGDLAEMLGAPANPHTHPRRFGLLVRPDEIIVRRDPDGLEIPPFIRFA